MADLRDRLRDLDALDVPDVMAHADRLGPKTPVEPGPGPARRVATIGFALLLAFASIAFVVRAFRGDGSTPADPEPTPTVTWGSCGGFESTDLGVPTDGGKAARLVAGTSMQDIWVVASTNPWSDQYLLHLDGQGWSEVALPEDLVEGYSGDLVAAGPNDLWLLDSNEVLRFDGTTWTRSALPGLEPEGVELTDLEVIAPNDAWVVGTAYDQATETSRPVVLHWDGVAWSDVEIGGAASGLVAVSAWGWDDVWVAGTEGGRNAAPVAMHWDGTAWSARPVGPDVRAAAIDTFGLVATGPDMALMTVEEGVLDWEEGAWRDTGFEAPSDMDVPLTMELGTGGVWAQVWLTEVAHWDGETWETQKSIYSYGMTVIDGEGVFVGVIPAGATEGPAGRAYAC